MATVDLDFKKLHADLYECSARCFNNPGSLKESRNCASDCTSRGFAFKGEIHNEIQKTKKLHQSCIQNCKENYPREQEGLKNCVYDCVEDGIQIVRKMTVKVQDMFKFYK